MRDTGPAIVTSTDPSALSKLLSPSPSTVLPDTFAVPDGVRVTATGLPAASKAVIDRMSSQLPPPGPDRSSPVPASMSFRRKLTFCTLSVNSWVSVARKSSTAREVSVGAVVAPPSPNSLRCEFGLTRGSVSSSGAKNPSKSTVNAWAPASIPLKVMSTATPPVSTEVDTAPAATESTPVPYGPSAPQFSSRSAIFRPS